MFINDNGDIKEIGVKAFDTLPVGAEIDYNGTEVPDGWEEVKNENHLVMRIRKVYKSSVPEGKIMNTKSDSVNDTYSCAKVVDIIYPVGSIYMSVNSTNPQVLFGGTWVAWGAGRAPVGVNTSETEFNTVEKTGGEKTHTLSVNEIPSHKHSVGTWYGGSGSSDFKINAAAGDASPKGGDTSGNTGGNQAHNNLQPYITCYMWKRTA